MPFTPPVPQEMVSTTVPFQITSLRIEQGRKYHSDVAREQWELEPDVAAVMHQHSFYELVYVLDGEMTQHMGNGVFRYHAGDALLLNRNVRHYEGSEMDCDVLFLCLEPDFLLKTMKSNSVFPDKSQNMAGNIQRFLEENQQKQTEAVHEYLDFACTLECRQHPELNPARELLEQLRQSFLLPGPGYAYQIQADLMRLLALLDTPGIYHLSRVRYDADERDFVYARVLRYLAERNGRISRGELGKALHYNGDYLNRLVKQKSGKTILQLGQEICIRQACRLLCETDLSIAAVLDQLGLSNQTYFYRLFHQQMGCTPQEYRRSAAEHPARPDNE